MRKRKVPLFLSYCHDDAADRQVFGELLASKPVELLVYDCNRRSGPWKQEIQNYIERARIAVFLITPAFIRSGYCSWEWKKALEEKDRLRLIPVLLEGKKLSSPLFPRLEDFHFPLLKAPVKEEIDPGKAWQKVVDFIGGEAQIILSRSSRGELEKESYEVLLDALGKGLFTPVLGSECHPLTEEFEEARLFLELRLQWLLSQELSSQDESYLRSVILSNVRGMDFSWQVRQSCDDLEWRRDLVKLQAAITRAGAEASRLFMKALNTGDPNLTDLDSVKVDLRPTVPKAKSVKPNKPARRLRELLVESAMLAADLEQKWSSKTDPLGLGIKGIRRHLVWLTWAIFCLEFQDAEQDLDERTEKWCEDHSIEDLSPRPRPEPPQLELWHLHWLADLLWHTLRFESPLYPSPKDLAFYFGLCCGRATLPRRISLERAALFASDEERVTLVCSALRGYASRRDASGSSSQRLFRCLTRATLFGLREREIEHASEASMPSWKAWRRVSTASKPHVIINVNFDMELERELLNAEESFAVLMPVRVQYRQLGEVFSHNDWLLTLRIADRKENEWLLWGDLDESTVQLVRDRLPGPLIMKVCGSPLQELPKALEKISIANARYVNEATIEGLKHRLIVSEIDLVTHFVPRGWRSLLAARSRVLCFIGHSTADLASQLQWHEFSKDDWGQPKLLAVEPPADQAQLAFYELAKAELLHLDIDTLPKIIDELLDSIAEERREYARAVR